MRGMRVFAAFAIAGAAILAASCGGINDPSKNTDETFTATLQLGGQNTHRFTSSKTGEISVKLTALAPTSNAIIGLVWTQATNDGTCAGFLQQAFATLNVPAIAGPVSSQRYCILVQDIGGISVAQNYTLLVSHP